MKLYASTDSSGVHAEAPGVGVLLVNLGTPDGPTAPALRRYLREFLADPRVVETSRPLWWLVLHLFILPRRPRRSARLYARIWTPDGSPLLLNSQRLTAALGEALGEKIGSPLHVRLGMCYGTPPLADAVRELGRQGCHKLLVLPLYPQYASATTGAGFDVLAAELGGWRWVPELRTVASYHDEPAYIEALAGSIREAWQGGGEPDRLLLSFHGLPKKSVLAGDPYFCHCQKTARLLREALALPEERVAVAFQSRFGRAEWLKPYTDATLRSWAKAGVGNVDVVCPGFATDCLETLEEIAMENRELFLSSGGKRFRYLPALNDSPAHVRALTAVALRHLQGWTTPKDEWDAKAAHDEVEMTRARARAMGAT
jgi:protoporphyrin/coproporphyrin ferrochelatase